MIDYGPGPAANEVEIIVFGPGFGEAIAVHLGEGHWMLVDSCIDPDHNLPASSAYLNAIGVTAGQVKAIVASHWHDDHVRGISRMSEMYPNADFFIPGVFTSEEKAAAFLAAYSGHAAPKLARGAKELFQVMASREIVHAAQERSALLELGANGHTVRVTSLSPSPQAFVQSIAHLAQFLPAKTGVPITHAPELKPNLEAVVVHIDLGHDAILLGSDLEDTGNLGWSALVADNWCGQRPPATVYKIAHHGSKTGHHDLIWTNMLKPAPIVPMTPFNHGRHRLPTAQDKGRIKALAGSAYISSGATKRPDLDTLQLKRLGDVCKGLSRVNAGFGAVRLRKAVTSPNWQVKLFGAAQQL